MPCAMFYFSAQFYDRFRHLFHDSLNQLDNFLDGSSLTINTTVTEGEESKTLVCPSPA